MNNLYQMKSFPEKNMNAICITRFFDDLSGHPVEVKAFQPQPAYHTFRR